MRALRPLRFPPAAPARSRRRGRTGTTRPAADDHLPHDDDTMAGTRQVFFTRLLHSRGVCRIAPPRSVAAAITAAGDLVSQTVWEGRELVDRPRLLVCTALGYALDGAALQRWYAFLHHRLPPATLGRKLLWHHAAFAPLAIAAFLASTAACAGREPWQRVRQELWPAICAHCAIVAPTQLVNAWLVPKIYQVLVANSFAFVWATVLSRLSHRPLPCS